MTEKFDHVIVGGGMTADGAAKAIHETTPDATILILSADVDAPYTRPALSKKLWIDPDYTEDDNDLGTVADSGAELRLRTMVESIDRTARTVTTTEGDVVGYGRLLLATGGSPAALDLPDDDRVISFRTAEDYRRLRSLSGGGRHVAVVGGGYIGTEIAAALAQNGTRVTLVFPDDVLGGSVFPAEIAATFEKAFEEARVALARGRRVESGTADDSGIHLVLDDGSTLDADAVVVGLGISVDDSLAADAGLAVDDGIVVDERLRTDDPDVFAAGDVASYPDAILGRRRVEHVDNAKSQGPVAGRNMAGADEVYDHTPYYYSKVFDISYEAVGTLDASLDTVVDDKGDGRSVAYYLGEDGVVAGVLLWNVEEARDAARETLAAGAVPRDELVGRI
ncbi:NAD(P)/FAD-dependent oxidoreductase [Frigoribacterium faeni]|uniref:NADPH-dependent 2,4-dienoyl-CoA reductase/sulfur reductase-like enzyme n=1 Tax=Frigoribacterium faeni TaxID=145483 RepID=A0A7W3PIQ6_9MICO|nr:FAD-dependent oxidoreductase [Frigoribacterium faeni]MBA8813283.1 NADPH-dependent 2,4-dienoyl-CoA reductase/sulfur reductase-like enzyme [Frigoribacterium faeni]BFF14498.1 NAD(P)/FAD-dependent oxidoreductase [Microbacterium flavescens]GEK82937.1 pyridine nucleotide-disulfide oxidoreductase [Frigoribacterium faeni]